MREVFFYSFKREQTSSAGMRAFQIYSELINFQKCDVRMDIENIKNSIVVFIKQNHNLNIELLKKSKENNNINVLDYVDMIWVNPNDENDYRDVDLIENGYNTYIDAYIVNNNFMRKNFLQKYKKFTFTIPHHYDHRVEKQTFIEPKEKKLEFMYNGYIGHTNQNCLYLNELQKNYNLKIEPSFKECINNPDSYNRECHVSIRKTDSWEFNVKPAMKLAMACSLNKNIVTTYDMSVRDILDKEYPYIVYSDDYESVIKMMDYVKKTYNTDIWFKGLEIIKKLKQRLSLKYIVKNYYFKFFKQLDDRFNS